MARTSKLTALDARVLRRIPRLWLPMAFVGALGLLLFHQRDRDRDRALAWERGAGVVRLQTGALEAELDGLAALTAQLAGREGVARVLARSTVGEEERQEMLELLRLHDELARLQIRDGNGQAALVVERDGTDALEASLPLPFPQSGDGILLTLGSPPPTDGEPGRLQVHAIAPVAGAGGTPQGSFVSSRACKALVERLARTPLSAGWCTLVDDQGRYALDPDASTRSPGSRSDDTPSLARDHAQAWESMRSEDRGQILLAEGLFTWLRVGLERRFSWGVSPAPSIVSFVPERAIYAESSHTLRRLLLLALPSGLLLLALAWRLAWGDALRLLHIQDLAASQERLQQLSQRLLDVLEEERRSVSRDLHDEVGQLATAMTIDLKRAQQSDDPEKRARLIERARASAERTITAVRDLAARLRSSVLDDLGLVDALENLCDELRPQAAASLQLRCRLGEEPDAKVASCVYRFTQEALTNVVRHASARSVSVDVESADGVVRVRVRDDGVGFALDGVPDGRLGLLGMRERVQLAGGTFGLESAPGHGTLVTAVIPLQQDTPEREPS